VSTSSGVAPSASGRPAPAVGGAAPASTNGRASGLAPPAPPPGAGRPLADGATPDEVDTDTYAEPADTLSQLLERKRGAR